MATTSYLKLVIVVIQSVTPHILFVLFVFLLEKSLGFVFREILIKHSVNLKKTPKNKDVPFPIRTMYNSILFTSKLSSVTVGFLVKIGFGVS